jgi:hypothetical protein
MASMQGDDQLRYFAADANADRLQTAIFWDAPVTRPCMLHVWGFSGGWPFGELEIIDDPDSPRRRPTDVMVFLSTVLFLSDRAKSALEQAIDARTVEWLPVRYRNERWWIMHGLVLLDALDEQRSEVRRGERSGGVVAVGRLRVIAEKCKGHALFRLSRGFETWVYIVSSDFVDAWNKAGLKGFDFIPLDDAPDGSPVNTGH